MNFKEILRTTINRRAAPNSWMENETKVKTCKENIGARTRLGVSPGPAHHDNIFSFDFEVFSLTVETTAKEICYDV